MTRQSLSHCDQVSDQCSRRIVWEGENSRPGNGIVITEDTRALRGNEEEGIAGQGARECYRVRRVDGHIVCILALEDRGEYWLASERARGRGEGERRGGVADIDVNMGECLAVPEEIGQVRRAGYDERFADGVDLAEVEGCLFRCPSVQV